jgi:hypothetical protein
MPPPQVLAQAAELQALRVSYAGATPSQRLKVAIQRINNPTAYANELVTRVSAVEAFARSLLANVDTTDREQVQAKHKKLESREATSLVEAYSKLHGVKPKDVFGEELWETFRVAVSARNLLVHECTYLDAQKYLPMAHSCTEVLFGLAKLSNTRVAKRAA